VTVGETSKRTAAVPPGAGDRRARDDRTTDTNQVP
jgi:hypothetical protein